MRLQAKFDAQLRERFDFVDIEGGADTNLIAGSTFRRPTDDGSHGATVVLGLGHGDDDAGERPNISDSPRARAWALFSQAAHELPTDAEMRSILVDVADTGNLLESARRNRVSRFVVYDKATRLCEAIGINRRWLFAAVTDRAEVEPEPAAKPVRRLTKKEIKHLNFVPPGERRAS